MALTPGRLSAPPAAFADTSPPPPISIGTVHGSFFANPNNSGAFDVSPTTGGGLFGGGTPTQPAFTQDFPTIDFDPPADANVQKNCSNPTGINEYSRPFVDVAPQPDGSCLTETAQGNGQQAGAGGLSAFEAVFTATLTVAQPGQITFNLYSDDGWVLGAGQDSAGDQPTYQSGSMVNPPNPPVIANGSYGSMPFKGYSVIGSYNQESAPAQNTVTVNFPAGGTYPIELDYTECCGGQEALVLGTSFANPIVPQNPAIQQRKIVFVHGINGNYSTINAGADYGGLINPLRGIYAPQNVQVFSYYQDLGYALDPNADPPQCGSGAPAPDTRAVGVIPVSTTSTTSPQCDSESDLGLNATRLDDALKDASTSGGGGSIAVIAHSMGGAITRGWLDLAQRQQDQTLKSVDTVVTFQGAQQGSYLPNEFACSPLQDHVTTRAVLANVATQVAHKIHFYPNRPAWTELKPQSSWYRDINSQNVPGNIHYYNFYTNIQVDHYKLAGLWPIPNGTDNWGDLVMLPGTNTPTGTPCSGGARFLPGAASPTADGAGPDGYQWNIDKQYLVLDTPGFDPVAQLPTAVDLYNIATDPANHLNLGGRLNDTSVTVSNCTTGNHITVTTMIEHILADPAQVCQK